MIRAGIGVVGLIIVMGILFAGVAADANEEYSDMNDLKYFNYDEVLEEIDYNVMLKIDTAFEDKNIPTSFKKTIHYIARGVVDGLFSSIYMGKLVNDIEPGIYIWIRENLAVVVAILILLMCPQILGIIMTCILGLILIIKERFWKKEHKRPKNSWRDNNGS